MCVSPQVSLQTFTIRRELKNCRNLKDSFARVKSLGINSLELSRIPFTESCINLVAEACKETGLSVRSTQMKLKEIERDKAWTIDMHKKMNCMNCAVSVISFTHLKKGEKGMQTYAQRLNRLGHFFRKEGISLLFHHHNFEFVPIGGNNGFTLLLKYLDPQAIGFVFDTYWLQRSGHDPADFIRRHKGIVKGVHLRDFSLKGPLWNPGIRDAEIGKGNLNFREIIAACREAEVDYMAIEQNTADPWNSLKISVEHLKDLGVEL